MDDSQENPFSRSMSCTVSQMTVMFADENKLSSSSIIDKFQLPEPLIIPSNGDVPQTVQRDGPKGKGSSTQIAMSVQTHNGVRYVPNHGLMVEEGYFVYQHISSDLMISLLKLGPGETPTLTPDTGVNFTDGTTLVAKYQKGTPTSETAKLLSVKFDMVLALEYSDDPSNYHAQLVLIRESQVNHKIQSGVMIITEIQKRVSISPISRLGKNNVALYFETSKFFYYVHVNNAVNPPTLDLQRVSNSPKFSPNHEFFRHLQFVEKPLSDEEGGHSFKLESVTQNHGTSPRGPGERKFTSLYDRSQSVDSASIYPPTGLDHLHVLSEPNIFRDRVVEKESNTSKPFAPGEENAFPKKEALNDDSNSGCIN